MAVTLKQIADMAGVHKSTVDKVIHDRPGVSEAKREEIRRLLDEYGYEANPVAKALNYQKKNISVAVVIPQIDALPYLKNGIEVVRPDLKGFNINIDYHTLPIHEPQQMADCLRQLRDAKTGGILLVPIEAPEVAEAMKEVHEAGIPLITMNTDIPDAQRLCFVGQDMKQAGRTAARMMQLLLPQGGRCAVISSDLMRAHLDREEAFRSYLAPESALWPVDAPLLIHESPENAYRAAETILRRTPAPDALYVTCGCVSSVCEAVRDAGYAGKLRIITFERYPEIKELVHSGVISCTIGIHLAGQGRLAMRLLFEHLVYGKEPKQKQFFLKNEILLDENI